MICEKCWSDAYEGGYSDQAARYHELLEERKDNPCSFDERRGQNWGAEEYARMEKGGPSDYELRLQQEESTNQ